MLAEPHAVGQGRRVMKTPPVAVVSEHHPIHSPDPAASDVDTSMKVFREITVSEDVPVLDRHASTRELASVVDMTPLAWASGFFAVGSIALLTTVLILVLQNWRTGRALPNAGTQLPDAAPVSDQAPRTGHHPSVDAPPPFRATVWRLVNENFGASQVEAVERCMDQAGYRFGVEQTHEVALPLTVRLHAADEIACVRERAFYPSCTKDHLRVAMERSRIDGSCLNLVEEIVSAARHCGKYVHLQAVGQAE